MRKKERIDKQPSERLLQIIDRANLIRMVENIGLPNSRQLEDDYFYPELLDVLVEIAELYQSTLDDRAKLEDFFNEKSFERFVLPDFELPTLFAVNSNSEIVDTSGLRKRFLDLASHFFKVTFDESHQIQIGWTGLAENLLGYDIRRFRKCPICQKFFWAERIDKNCCSRECSNVQNQRVFQSDPNKREEYNAKRRETYKSKREQKQGKKRRKKNGTL
jgi:hypothetical protein